MANEFGQIKQVIDARYSTLAVPQALVQTDARGFYVYLLKHGKALKQYFTPGEVTQSGLMVVRSGLRQGAVLIASDLNQLNAGQIVKVIKQ